MAPPRSLLLRMAVDNAKRSHNCQHNKGHRIAMGDKRLGVTVDGSPEYYCVACGRHFLELARSRADELLAALQ